MASPVRWMMRQFGYVPAARPPAGDGRRAGYDAERTDDENRKHWRHADGSSAQTETTPAGRATVRNRAREEVRNNPYAGGLVRTLVNDTIGTGPRLQMQTPDLALNAAVEDLYRKWSAAANLALTYRINCGVRVVAGDCFAVFRNSARLERLGLPVSLDLRLIEPDQVTDPFGAYQPANPTGDEGVVCDDEGEVVAYRILKRHPGDRFALGATEFAQVPAADVVHWFLPARPGQLRGVSEFAPALDTFAQIRRFSKATLTAAEVASLLAGVLELPDLGLPTGVDGSSAELTVQDTIELVRGMLVTVPQGGKVTQFKPEQPTATHEAFVNLKLRECGRHMQVPFGKMVGDHSRYNYSSARMDDGNYWQDRAVERQALEVTVFDPVLYRFLDFARFALPRLAAFRGQWWELKHTWHYDARLSIDPVKDATGDELNLTNGTDTLAGIAARDGTTAEALLDQRQRELRMFLDRGLPLPPWLAGTPAPARQTADAPAPQPQEAGRAA